MRFIAVAMLAGLFTAVARAEPGVGFTGAVAGDPIPFVDSALDDELFPVVVNHWWGLMNGRGQLVIPMDFDWADCSYDGIVRVTSQGLTTFIKGNGVPLIAEPFPFADRFAEGYAIVGDGTRVGVIDKRGKAVVPVKLDGALRFCEGFAAVMHEGRCGFIDVTGKLVIPMQYAQARSFSDGMAMVVLPADIGATPVRGYIDKRGRWVCKDEHGRFAELGDFRDGLAKVRVGTRWGYIDRTMRVKIEPAFDAARDFHGGVAAVMRDGRWGYIDKRGRFVVEPIYDAADDFDENLAMVKRDGRFGYIDRTGRVAIEPAFLDARPFMRGYAFVSTDAGWGYIDITGRTVWDPRRALQHGFVDIRSAQTARVLASKKDLLTRSPVLVPPPPRAAVPAPYPPEHLYEPILPDPRTPSP